MEPAAPPPPDPGTSATGGPGLPPPGWYVDPAGGWRWWDGRAWGPAAGAPPSNRTLAVLSHLGSLLGGFLLPLVIYLTADRRDRYLRHHASEGLNFQLTLLVGVGVAVVAMLGAVALGAVGTSTGDGTGFAAVFGGFVVVWLLVMALSLGGMVLGVVGAVRAHQGVWWRYPVCVRFVRGAVAPGVDGGDGALP